jgi:hypothetical protein
MRVGASADAVLCGQVQEGGSVTITAPAGDVISSIEFASYGAPSGSCGSFFLGTCDAASSLPIVEQACLGESSCTVTADNATFGDPCVGEFKRLYIQAAVTPRPVPGPSTLCGQASEGGTVSLTAPTGEIITSIDFASYGTPLGACGGFFLGICNATSSRSVVEAACLGKSSCSVAADNFTFGDPCGGTVKRLYVQATTRSLPTPAHRTTWGAIKTHYH